MVERNKKYYKNHTEKVKEIVKKYKRENPEKIREIIKNYAPIRNENRRNAESIICDCGGHYKIDHKTRHLKTKKHLNFFK